MSEEQPNTSEKQGDSNAAPSFGLQRTYVKDLSLEMPNAPNIFLESDTPTVEVELRVDGQRLAETAYESAITATITTRVNNQVLYLIELCQAGIFEAANIPPEQLDPLLGIVCPTMLFPYLRANVADAITRTSLPPLHLNEVNFQALYEQRQSEQQNRVADGSMPETAAAKPPQND